MTNMPKLVGLDEVAGHLGVNPVTLQRWCKAGKFLPAKRLGAAWVWNESELAAYLSNGLPTAHECAAKAAEALVA